MVKVRKAVPNDAPELKKILFRLMSRFERMDSFDTQDRAHWKKKSTAEIRKLIRAKDKDFIVIEEGGRIVGSIEVIISKREGVFKIKKNGHIETTFIDPKYRGKGYGRLLLNEAMKWFRKKGMKYATLGTHAKDSQANSFWKRMGFREYNVKYRKTIRQPKTP